MGDMPELRVEPAGYRIDVQPGESLIEAAWRARYWWPTRCYAAGQCTACGCEVIEGLDRLSPRTEPEERMLCAAARGRRRVDPQRMRLACQATIAGDITVRKPGVRPETLSADGDGDYSRTS